MTLMQCSFETRRAIPEAELSLRADELTVQIKMLKPHSSVTNPRYMVRNKGRDRVQAGERTMLAEWCSYVLLTPPPPTSAIPTDGVVMMI